MATAHRAHGRSRRRRDGDSAESSSPGWESSRPWVSASPRLGEHPERRERCRAHHALRRVRAHHALRRRGEGLHVHGLDAPQGDAPLDLFVHFGVAATRLVLDDAGFTIDDSNAERVGVNVGSGIGGLPMIEDNIREMIAKGPRRLSPFFVPGRSSTWSRAYLDPVRPRARTCLVTACTTGPHCIGDAGAHDRVRRRRRDDRGRRRGVYRAGRGRLRALHGALGAQRRPDDGHATVRQGPRRLRAGRGRGRRHPRGATSTRRSAARHLRRSCRQRHERRREPHHRARTCDGAPRACWRRCRMRRQSRRRAVRERARHLDAAGRLPTRPPR